VLREPEFRERRRLERDSVRILLVEDDPHFAELLRAQLRRMRGVAWRLEVVGTVTHALAKLAAESYGLVVTDLDLPDSQGIETVGALVRAGAQPVIVLTGDQNPTLRAVALELGAYDLISKERLTAEALERLLRLAAVQADAHRAAREADARVAALLKLSNDWYWEQDESFRYTRFDGRVDELLASDSRPLIGKRRWEIPSNEPVHGTWAEHRALLEAHLPFRNFETRRRGDDGALHYVSASGEPVFDAAGRFRGYRGIAAEITQKKLAEAALTESEARFRRTFELAASGMAHIGMDRRFIRVNRRLCEILGYSEQELLGRTGRDISHPDDLDIINQQRPRLYTGEIDSVRLEKRYLRKDRSIVWVKFTMTVERDSQGKPLYEIGVYDDISAQRQAEERLRESEARFRSLSALSSDWFWETDTEHRFRDSSSGVVALTGLPPSAYRGRSRWQVPGLSPLIGDWQAHRDALARREVFRDLELVQLRADGARVYLQVSGEPVYDAQGSFYGYRGTARDITARKREERLLRLEHEASKILAHARSAAAGARAVLAAICASEGWKCGRFFLRSGDVVRFDEASSFLEPQFETLLANSRNLAFRRGEGLAGTVWETGRSLWVADTSRDPRVKWALSREKRLHSALLFPVQADGELLGVASMSNDRIREPHPRLQRTIELIGSMLGQFLHRWRTQEALRASESRLRAVMNAEPQCVKLVDGEGLLIEMNPAGLRMIEADDIAPLRGKSVYGLVAAEHRPAFRELTERVARGEEGRLEFEIVGLKGGRRWLETHAVPLPDAATGKLLVLGITRDVTERRRGEAALRESEKRFRQTFELAGSGMAHVGLDGRFLRVNRRLCEMLGYSNEELVGRSVKDISHPDDREATDAERARLYAGEVESVEVQKRYVRRDGEVAWIDLTIALARDADGKPLHEISILEDVTQEKAAEAALRESEARFRSLTELSADFYWETDAQHRVLRTTHGGGRRPIDSRQIGKTRWDIPSTLPDEAGWARHRATVEAWLPFRDFELARIDTEGVERHLSISGEPVFDAAGKFAGYRGVGKEITERKREQALRALEHEVTRHLAAATTGPLGLKAVLREICVTQKWPAGRYFNVDGDVLRFSEAWGQPTPQVENYIARSRELVYQRGQGLSGRVWETGKALWVRDVSKDPRASGSSRAVLQGGAFVFPVKAGERILGIMSFSSSDVREPDDRLLRTVGVIGAQVGQFLMRKKAERKQRRREEDLLRFRAAMDMTADAIYLADRATLRFVDVNKIGCAWLGYTREELLAMSPADILPVTREQLEREYDEVIAAGAKGVRLETPYTGRDGRSGWTELYQRALRSGEGWLIVTISRDINERKLAEQRQAAHLRYQERIARFGQSALAKREPGELMEQSVQAVLEALDAEAVAYIEPGKQLGEIVVRALVGVAAGPSVIACRSDDPAFQALQTGSRLMVEGGELTAGWARNLGSVALVPVRGESSVRGVVCVGFRGRDAFSAEALNFVDAAASVLSTALLRIDSEGRLAYLAQFDPLTGLPNRALLADRFSQMIVQAKRRDQPLAVLFIDLDEFKMVNDTLGHAGGDALLKETAVRLQSAVRTGDTVARISGDEFAIVLADLARQEDAALVAQKVIERLSAAVEIHGKEVFITASVGIAAFPADGADAETLIGAADAAMYRAKQSGRNAYQFFTAEINQRSRARAQMGIELRRALEREEFALVYQPKYNLADRRVSGAEALLRWRHPERGIVSPVEFIPVLEETGLIVAVGEWVIRRACEDLKRFNTLPVSINLSARQFRQPDLHKRITALVQAAGVDPALIELEITESQLMQDPDHAIRVMQSLCDAGIRLAIDDFGTGYSSLAYLTRFPLSALKIDRSFVKDMASDKADATIVRTIIEMAHTLGFTVVAEGVETEEQAAFLKLLRCEQAQGYLFARPMSAEEFVTFCKQ
jgi:diguanylate cyclase (GGDEF)-like protein/PAS domain S-box-containing protein